MVDIALVFVGIAVLVHLLLLAAAVYFIPRVLAEEDLEVEHEGHEGGGTNPS